jgi:hypothetical protein
MSFLNNLAEIINKFAEKSEGYKNKKVKEHNIKLIKIFINHLNIIVSKMATEENLSSQTDISARATEIFKDALRIEPETEKGKIARIKTQKYIIKLSGEHIRKLTNEEIKLFRDDKLVGFSEDKKKKLANKDV